MNRKYIAVVNIGTSAITVVIGQRSAKGGLDIAGYASVASRGVKRGVVQDKNQVVRALKEAITNATNVLNIRVCKVVVGISGPKTRAIQVNETDWTDNSGKVNQRNIDKLLEKVKNTPLNPGEKIFHLIPQSFTIDQETEIRKPIGKDGTKLDGHFQLLVAPDNYYKSIEQCFEPLNIKVRGAVISPLATTEAIISDEEKETGVIQIDMGAGTTQVAVYYKGSIRHAAIIPFGGNSITQDIAKGCSLDANISEKLKRKHGYAMAKDIPTNKILAIPNKQGGEPKEVSLKNLASIIQARLEEILECVWFQVNKSGCSDPLNAGIVITGGGSRLKGIVELIKMYTDMNVRIGGPRIPVQGRFAKEISRPENSNVIGLFATALIRFRDNETFVSPIEEEPKPQPEKPERKIEKPIREKSGFKKFSDFVGELFSDDDMSMK